MMDRTYEYEADGAQGDTTDTERSRSGLDEVVAGRSEGQMEDVESLSILSDVGLGDDER